MDTATLTFTVVLLSVLVGLYLSTLQHEPASPPLESNRAIITVDKSLLESQDHANKPTPARPALPFEHMKKETTQIALDLSRQSLQFPSLATEQVEQVSIDGNDHLLVRLKFAQGLVGSGTGFPLVDFPSSVIVKRFEPAKYILPSQLIREQMLSSDSYRHATLDFLREARALELFNGTFGVRSPEGLHHHTYLAPLYYGADLDAGVLAMQDLGGTGSPLYEKLGVKFSKDAGEKPLTAAEAFHVGHAFVRVGEAFAHLHAPQFVDRAFASLPKGHPHEWLLEVSRYHDYDLFQDSAKLVRDILSKLGIQPAQGLSEELDRVGDQLLNPGAFLAFTHGDVCADNIFLMHGTNRTRPADPAYLEPMLIDYSSSGLRHSLADLATLYLLFPTCWCAGDIPAPFLTRLTATYRQTLLREIAQLKQQGYASPHVDIAELERALLDDGVFNQQLLQMATFHTFVVIAEYWDDALEDRQCGHASCRSHVFSRLTAFLQLASKLGGVPAVQYNMEDLFMELRKQWSDMKPLPAFPTFARLSGSPRQSAARVETRRLQQVTAGDAMSWLRSGGEPQRLVDAIQATPGTPLRELLKGRVTPVKLEGTVASKWSALDEWKSIVDVAKLSRPDSRWTIKKRGFEMAGTVTRFPIGCCHTTKVVAGSIVKHQGCILNDCEMGFGIFSPYYASVLIDSDAAHGDPLLGYLTAYENLIADARPNASPITNIWAASKGSITPLHYDPFHNSFVQVSGRKRFLLIAPSHWRATYLHPRLHLRHRQAQLNLNDPDLLAFPRASELVGNVLEVVVGPGDTLYVPPYWFHQVESLDDTVSVSIFTESVELNDYEEAWETILPVDAGNWGVAQVTSFVGMFLEHLVEEVFPGQTARAFVSSLLETRYDAKLYKDVLSAEMEPHRPDAGDLADPHYVQFELESSTAGGCLLGGDDLCNKKQASKDYCALLHNGNFRAGQVGAIKPTVDKLRGLFSEKQEAGILEIVFENFVEDVAGRTVGDRMAFAFLSRCFATGG